MAGDREIRVTVLGEASSAQRALAAVGESSEGAGTKLDTFGNKIGSALSPAKLAAGVGMLTGALGGSVVEMGDKLEKSEKQLQAAAEAAGIPLKQLDEISKSSGKAMENFGHTTTETNGALQALMQAGRPASEVQKDLALSADLAAAKHISLTEAAGLIAKVYGGNSKVLKQFGIDVKSIEDPQKNLTKAEQDNEKTQNELGKVVEENKLKHMAYAAAKTHSKVATEELRLSDQKLAETQQTAKASTDFLTQAQADAASGATKMSTVIDEVTAKVHGQAAASMDTFGGKLDIVKVKFEDFIAKGAAKVGPAMVAAGPLVMGFSGIISSGLVPALISGVGSAFSFAGGMISAGLSAAAAAIPVMIAWAPVIIGIAAIGLVAYELYQHWDQVWGFIKGIASTAADWIKSHLELIALAIFLPFDPLILLVAHFDEAWGAVRDIVAGAWHFMRDAVGGGIADVVDFVAGLPGRLVGAVGDLGGLLWNAGWDLMDGLLHGIEGGAGRVWDALSSWAGKMLHAVTHPWEAFSPSRVTMRLGANIMDGLGIGISQAAPGAVSAASRAVSGLRGALGSAGAAGPGLGGLALANTGAGVVVNVNITVPGTLVGSDGMHELGAIVAPHVREQMLRMQRRTPLGFA